MNILHLISQNSEIVMFDRIAKFMPDNFEHYFCDVSKQESKSVEPDVVHAHSWFGAGGAASVQAAKLNVPFIVTIAQNDLKSYKNTLFFKKKSVCSILENASKVVFTNNFQQDFFANELPKETADRIFEHAVLITEPVDDFWIKNIRIHPPTALVHIKLLYVGELSDGAEIPTILNAVDKLRKKNLMVTFTAVSFGGTSSSYYGKMLEISKNKDCFNVMNAENNDELLKIYRNNDIMLLLDGNAESIVRFAEATTQGLPVIHLKDSAFSGLLPGKFTDFSITSANSGTIAEKILDIANNFGTIEQHLSDFSPFLVFDAREAVYRYEHLYNNVCIR